MSDMELPPDTDADHYAETARRIADDLAAGLEGTFQALFEDAEARLAAVEAERDELLKDDLWGQKLAATRAERDRLREAIHEHITWHGSTGHEGLSAALDPKGKMEDDPDFEEAFEITYKADQLQGRHDV